MKTLIKNNKYGWAICIVCALVLFCVVGLTNTGFSIYQPYLIKVRGLTNTEASLIPTIRNLFALIGMTAASVLVKRFEIRRVVTASTAVAALGFLITGLASGFPGTAAGAAVMGLAYGAGGMIPVSLLITRWFIGHRGFALGICMGATGLSATLASPVITLIIKNSSLEHSFILESGFILVSALIVWAVIRSRPDCLNTLPVGMNEETTMAEKRTLYAAQDAPKRLYILLAVGILIFGMSSNNAAPHIPVLYNAAGFSSGNVTGFVSIFGLTLAAGKCIYGGVVDRIGMYRANWILYGLSAVGFLLCCFADSGSIMTAYASVVLLGLGLSIMSVSIPLYAAGAATEKTYPHIMSVFQMMSIIGSLAFGTVPGIMADAMNGSYVPAFIVMLVMAVTGAALLQYGYKAVEHSAGEKGINNRKKNIMITHNAA